MSKDKLDIKSTELGLSMDLAVVVDFVGINIFLEALFRNWNFVNQGVSFTRKGSGKNFFEDGKVFEHFVNQGQDTDQSELESYSNTTIIEMSVLFEPFYDQKPGYQKLLQTTEDRSSSASFYEVTEGDINHEEKSVVAELIAQLVYTASIIEENRNKFIRFFTTRAQGDSTALDTFKARGLPYSLKFDLVGTQQYEEFHFIKDSQGRDEFNLQPDDFDFGIFSDFSTEVIYF